MPTDQVRLTRTAVVAIGLTFLLMGLVVSAYGPLLEPLTRRFGVSLPVAGATISVHFAGSLPGVLIAMRSFEMLSARLNVMIATAIVSTGLVVIAIAFVWTLFLAGVLVVGFVLYVGVENGAGGWMTSHLNSLGLSYRDAATITSGFWLALVTGRLLITLAPPAVPEPAIVLAGSAVAVVALLLASIQGIAPVAYIVCGLAIAPIFPTGIVWLAKRRPGDSRATSWLFPAAAIGGTAGPGLIGPVLAGFALSRGPVVLAAGGAP